MPDMLPLSPVDPAFVTRLCVLSFQHVDTGNSYLCGYLKIKGLTEVSALPTGGGLVGTKRWDPGCERPVSSTPQA